MRFWEATGEPSPADAWIEQIYSEYPASPFNPNQRAIVSGEGDKQTIALFELEPSKSVRGAVEIHWIQAYPQRQGVGTAAIRELQARARAAGIKMSLYPKPNGSVSQASLKRLYKRLGFNPIHKGAATMVWDPDLTESLDFMEGECPIMAIALHRLTGLPLMALVEHNQGETYLMHAYVGVDTKWRLDAEGFGTANWYKKQFPYDEVNGEVEEVSLTEQELLRLGYGADGTLCPPLSQVLPIAKEVIAAAKEDLEDAGVKLEEDWRHVVTGLGAASMIAGGGSAAYDAYKTKTQQATKPINPGLKGLSDRHNKYVGMKVATAKPQAKAAPAKVAQATAKPAKGKKV